MCSVGADERSDPGHEEEERDDAADSFTETATGPTFAATRAAGTARHKSKGERNRLKSRPARTKINSKVLWIMIKIKVYVDAGSVNFSVHFPAPLIAGTRDRTMRPMSLRRLASVIVAGSCIALLTGCFGAPAKPKELTRPTTPPDLRPDIVVQTGSLKALPPLREGMSVTIMSWGNPHDIERNFRTDNNLQAAPKTVSVAHPALGRYAVAEFDGHALLLTATKEVVGAVKDPTERRFCSKRGDECVTVIGNYVTININGIDQLMLKEQFFKIVYPDGYFLLIAAMAIRDFGPQEVLVFMPKK